MRNITSKNKKSSLGIIGGGQLGRMLVQAAQNLNIKTVVLDPTPQSPAGQIADKQVVGNYKDPKMIKKLASLVDFLTYEIESAHAQSLVELKGAGKSIHPSPKTLKIIQDKYLQKQILKKANVPVPDFLSVETIDDIKRAAKKFGFPLVIKARHHGFDGRGNARLAKESDIKKALLKLGTRDLYVEKLVPFKSELAIQVVKSGKTTKIYPLVETIQKNDICHIVIAPARVTDTVKKQANIITGKVAKMLKGNGVFAIEMFLTKNNKVLVNEIAPRVHNSGHYTIEATNASQFEHHVRAVCKLPLKSIKMTSPAAVMVNILGTRNSPAVPKGIESAQKLENVFVHIYGKAQTKKERKMGHVTALGENVKEALAKAQKARKLITI
ncbi:MAG: 5-(carboxyamino)imidazole ribonucleotide synthase [Candidatus Curtissbacteria bacterium]|nr:5-(carboxyamino)imidazole ribonucleotide synthase [Candidatus Curtissbacteria bacterium]